MHLKNVHYLFLSFLVIFIGVALTKPVEVHAQKLQASDGNDSDYFGYSVSVSGEIGFVGAYRDDDPELSTGAAYIFRNIENQSGTISESVLLQAANKESGSLFGYSVAVEDSIGVAGAYGNNEIANGAGLAYVFRNLDTASGTINENARLYASDAGLNDHFGYSVSLSGTDALIGAYTADGSATDTGAAYVFRNLDTVVGDVSESLKLTVSDAVAVDRLGVSVSLAGNMGLVGAHLADAGSTDCGAAYVFRNLDSESGEINESVRLVASDRNTNDQFGRSVSLSGSRGLVGAPETDHSGIASGTAYYYRNLDTATGQISESARLIASDAKKNDSFGYSVSLDGQTALVGAPNGNKEAAYLFINLDDATGNVTEAVKIKASDGTSDDFFGLSVSLVGDRFVIGAPRADGVSNRTGLAYTGTVSSLTTLDYGDIESTIDSISFQSQQDWIVGLSTSNNKLLLSENNNAEILVSGKSVFIGKNSGANDNCLTIAGSIDAHEVIIGSVGNDGNQFIIDSTGSFSIDTITLFSNNDLLFQGDYSSFDLLAGELGSTELYFAKGEFTELITEENFSYRLKTNFDETTGYTTFTAVPEPSSICVFVIGLAGLLLQRRRWNSDPSFTSYTCK